MAKNARLFSVKTSQRKEARPSLATYVRHRNGVSLGASGSLSGMLYRSFGSSSFPRFWNNWNPIWGYYLGYLIFKPLRKHLPDVVAVLLTFGVSGLAHDIAVSLILWVPTFIFTPWFTLMGAMVVVSTAFHLCYESRYWITRAALNLAQLAGSFLLVRWIIAY